MGSFTRKYKKNKQNINLVMAIKFKCPICGFERLVPQSDFKKMNEVTFKNNKLFIFLLSFYYFYKVKNSVQSPYLLAKFPRLGTIMKNHILSN